MHHSRVRRVRYLLAIPLLSVAFATEAPPARAELPACAAAPCPSDAGKPVVILAYYRDRYLRRLVHGVRHSGLPGDVPIYYGSYWGTGVNTRPPPSTPPPPRHGPPPVMPNRRYAPIFSFARTNFWEERSLTPEEEQAVRSGGYTGKIPQLATLLRKSGSVRYQAGLEVGRRFRDAIRYKRAHHLRVVTWQFDEIPNESVAAGGSKYLPIVQGILRGLTYGRPELGDVKLPGIVYASGRTVVGIHSRSFWNAVDDSSLWLVGEEYPDFVGAPGSVARAISGWRSRLPASLEAKYVAGLTPGYRLGVGLGGNVKHRSESFVNKWRLGYVRTRALEGGGLAGFAQYNFNYHNVATKVVEDVMLATSRGIRLLRR